MIQLELFGCAALHAAPPVPYPDLTADCDKYGSASRRLNNLRALPVVKAVPVGRQRTTKSDEDLIDFLRYVFSNRFGVTPPGGGLDQ